ncbi:MAG: 16S rRNA (guanine(966)-N(2))-methyltransferase RsmD [Flavobacteriales bacterium]|nr:16S rRNA (guanine(966)-N(2))-methyltransferase RsmD [Flavobacteriales bacterium]
MRIIGGKYRGKKLPVSSKLDLRPTTDFAKESLFNLVQNKIDLEGVSFVDLFSGTGNISFELMSRGADRGIMVDISLSSFKYREKVLRSFDFKNVRNLKSDVLKFLRNQDRQYDLIFADPPYNYPHHERIIEDVFQHQLLKADGLLIIEHPQEYTFEKMPHFIEHRRYGRVNFSFFKP